MLDDFESASPSAQEAGGESLTVEEAIANLRHEDLSLRYYAAWWIGRFGVREPEAIDALLDLLQEHGDRTEAGGYPLQRNAARALGKVGDDRAVPALIDCLDSPDYYVREAAAEGLERLGDPEAIPALLKLLDGGVEAAVRVPGKPHLNQPYDTIIEALGSLKATEATEAIAPFLNHSFERVQYSAARAMYQLTGDPAYGDRLVEALRGPKLQLRRSALIDLGAIGYLPAAPAIAQTLAENSIKLISLKGIVEHHLDSPEADKPPALSEAAIDTLYLMDSLL